MNDARLIERWQPISEIGDGCPGNAGVSPALGGCGAATVCLRAGHKRSQEAVLSLAPRHKRSQEPCDEVCVAKIPAARLPRVNPTGGRTPG